MQQISTVEREVSDRIKDIQMQSEVNTDVKHKDLHSFLFLNHKLILLHL